MASSLISHGGALLLVLLVFPLMDATVTGVRSNGFKIKLIPRDSVESPMYFGNLTREERLEQLSSLSNERAHQLASSIMIMANRTITGERGVSPDFIRPVVSAALSSYYVVQVSIGSPPAPFNLLLDTGSDFTWVQCSGCVNCFAIKGGSFQYHLSDTYKWLPCDHPLCDPPCHDDACFYDINYIGSARTIGIRSIDTFTFLSNNGALESIDNIAFGCGLNNLRITFGENTGPENTIAGIFGMGGGPSSFWSQLGQREPGLSRFSYCLPSLMESGTHSFLRFGEDANMRTSDGVKSTPLVPGITPSHYLLNLVDISVETASLGIPPGDFNLKPDGTGGFYVDTGAPFGVLVQDVYQSLCNAMELYFLSYKLVHVDGSQFGLDFCKFRPADLDDFPTMTFHFQGADLVLQPENVFLITDHYFCLAFNPNKDLSLLGAFQQTNYRFLYDIHTSMLSFSPEICMNV